MTSCEKKPRLFLDIETFSDIDIKTSGSFRYMESPAFEIMILAYAWEDGPVKVVSTSPLIPTPDQATDEEVAGLISALSDPDVVKVSHNTAFERWAFRTWLGIDMPPEEWEDTMILAAMNGLPMTLDGAGSALRLKDQKIKEGTSLISFFCKPCKATKANGGRTRNLPEHAPEKWARFVEYCRRDVEVAQAIYYRLKSYKITDFERKVFELDARINERGVMIDRTLAEAAVAIDEDVRAKHLEEMQRLTGLDNPNSVAQLKGWLEEVGVEVESLNKATLTELKSTVTDNTIKRVIELRQQLGKTSTTKYATMLAAACKDDRVRGLTQYYGAGRTGRWAGRLIQLQNLPQNHLEPIEAVRAVARTGDAESTGLLFDSVPDTLSQLIRTALIAKPGCTFLVADYSAIEARVIAYLAGETWRNEVFAEGGDIYCSSASQMFKVPVVKHGINGHLRQKGKVAELACGYGGGVNALKAFGADKMGLSEEEMQSIVTQWRLASPTIPKLWRDTERAAKAALENPGSTFTLKCGVKYHRDADALRCKLPSGRILSYWGARILDGSIVFMGQNQTTRKWEKTETWGGKLVENIVQAYARDCLAVAMLRLDEAGYKICFSVHDELICEEPVDGRTWQEMAEIMGRPIDWAPGLKLNADGYATDFYKKD